MSAAGDSVECVSCSISTGSVVAGQEVTYTVVEENTSPLYDAEFDLEVLLGDQVVSTSHETIPQGEQKEFNVTFTPGSAGEFEVHSRKQNVQFIVPTFGEYDARNLDVAGGETPQVFPDSVGPHNANLR